MSLPSTVLFDQFRVVFLSEILTFACYKQLHKLMFLLLALHLSGRRRKNCWVHNLCDGVPDSRSTFDILIEKRPRQEAGICGLLICSVNPWNARSQPSPNPRHNTRVPTLRDRNSTGTELGLPMYAPNTLICSASIFRSCHSPIEIVWAMEQWTLFWMDFCRCHNHPFFLAQISCLQLV